MPSITGTRVRLPPIDEAIRQPIETDEASAEAQRLSAEQLFDRYQQDFDEALQSTPADFSRATDAAEGQATLATLRSNTAWDEIATRNFHICHLQSLEARFKYELKQFNFDAAYQAVLEELLYIETSEISDPRVRFGAIQNYAMCLFCMGDYSAALEQTHRVVSIMTEAKISKPEMFDEILFMSMCMAKDGRIDACLNLLHQSFEGLDSGEAGEEEWVNRAKLSVLAHRAAAHGQFGDREDALEDLRRAQVLAISSGEQDPIKAIEQAVSSIFTLTTDERLELLDLVADLSGLRAQKVDWQDSRNSEKVYLRRLKILARKDDPSVGEVGEVVLGLLESKIRNGDHEAASRLIPSLLLHAGEEWDFGRVGKAQFLERIGDRFMHAGNVVRALPFYQEAVRSLGPSSGSDLVFRVSLLRTVAEAHLECGDIEGAAESILRARYAEDACGHLPVEILIPLAETHARVLVDQVPEDNWERAIDMLERVREPSPEQLYPLVALHAVRAFLAAGQMEEGDAVLREVFRMLGGGEHHHLRMLAHITGADIAKAFERSDTMEWHLSHALHQADRCDGLMRSHHLIPLAHRLGLHEASQGNAGALEHFERAFQLLRATERLLTPQGLYLVRDYRIAAHHLGTERDFMKLGALYDDARIHLIANTGIDYTRRRPSPFL